MSILDEMRAPEYCALCGAPITPFTEPDGVIFTCIQVDSYWTSAAVCTADFMRGRSPVDPRPHRVLWEAYLS